MGYHLSLSMNSPLIKIKNYLCGLLFHRFFIKNIFTRFKVGYQVCLMPAMQFVLYDNIFTKSEKGKKSEVRERPYSINELLKSFLTRTSYSNTFK